MAKKETIQLELTVDQKKAREAMSEIQKEISDIQKGFKGLTAGTKEYEKQIQKLEDATRRWAENAPIADLQKEMNKLNREVKQLVPGTQAYIEKSKQLSVVRDRLKEVNNELRGIQQEQDKAGNWFTRVKDNIKTFGAGVIAAFSIQAIAQFISGLAQIISGLAQTASEFIKLRGQTQQLTQETGDALNKLVAQTSATAKTFGKDYNEVLQATNTLAKQLGITQTEAATLIQKGFLAGADSSGQFLDILKEYPAQFAQVGLSAEESIAIITQSVQDGVFSDKGADAIKEAGLRLSEFGKPAQEAIDAIGLNSKKIQQELRSGAKTTADVMKEVSAQIKTLPANSAAASQAITAIFGGAGEDAGRKFIENISAAKTGIDGLIDGSNQLVAAQMEQLKQQERVDKAWARISEILAPLITYISTLIIKIKAFVLEGLETVLNFFDNFGANMQLLRAKIIEGVNTIITSLNKLTGGLGKYIGIDLNLNTIALDKSSAQIEAELEAYRQKREQARQNKREETTRKNTDAIAKIQTDAAKKVEKAIETIQKGSIADLRKQISELQKKIDETTDLSIKVKLLADLGNLQKQLDTAEQQLISARNEMSGLKVPVALQPIPQEQVQQVTDQVQLSEEQLTAITTSFSKQRHDDQVTGLTSTKKTAQERYKAEQESINATANALGSLSGGFSTLADALGEGTEAAKAMRTISLALAAAQNIAAVAAGINAISHAAGQPFPANIVAIASTVGALGAAISSITALIKSTQAQPKFAQGGKLPTAGKGGIPTGASHAAGGIALLNTNGQKIGEIEGGEPILSLATYRNNKELIDHLLYASMFMGGRKIFANGGFLPGQTVATQVTPAASGITGSLFANTQNTLIAQNAQIINLLKAQKNQKLVAVLSPKTFNEVQEQSTNFTTRSKL